MIETERLKLRKLEASDLASFVVLFGDAEVMKSSDHGTLTPAEVTVWLKRQIEARTSSDGIDLLAVVGKQSSSVLGYCGLTLFPNLDGEREIEIGYRLIREYWHLGYATEAAIAVRDYAFSELKLERLVALIEPVNNRSIRVAEKIGMTYEKEVLVEGYDHPDYLYSIEGPSVTIDARSLS